MGRLGLVISLVAAGCGDSTKDLPSQIGAAPDLIGAVAVAGFDGGFGTMATASVLFGTAPADFAGIPVPRECTSVAELTAQADPTALPGAGDRDLGPEVVVQSGATVITASRTASNGQFTYSGSGASFASDASYDLVAADAAPPLTVTSVARAPARLTLSSPSTLGRLTLGSPLETKWTGSGGELVAITIYPYPTGEPGGGIVCFVPDSGSFTVPGQATSLLGAASSYILMVGRERTQMTNVTGLGSVLGIGVSGAYAVLVP